MSDTATERPRAKRSRPPSERKERRPVETKYLVDWLASLELEAKPSLHVNGHGYGGALLCVDFGTPLKPTKLTPEQSAELNERMKKLARDVLGRESANVRVSFDSQNGVYWASTM